MSEGWKPSGRGAWSLALLVGAASACTRSASEPAARSGTGAAPVSPDEARPSAPPAGVLDRRVDIGGLALHLHCEGTGAPTVVFDSGLGRDGRGWFESAASAGRATARLTRACAYDRAGRGRSDPPAARPHSNRQMARELHALLERAGERGPFVLAGHSMGGTNARFFLEEHPESVAGLVLIDASPDPPPLDRVPPEARAEFERGLAQLEGLDVPTLLAAFDELAASRASLGDKPLAVLVAGRLPDEALAAGVPDAARAAAQAELAARHAAQARLTALSTNSQLVVLEHAGHDIPNDAPASLARAVAAVVEAARGGARLEPLTPRDP